MKALASASSTTVNATKSLSKTVKRRVRHAVAKRSASASALGTSPVKGSGATSFKRSQFKRADSKWTDDQSDGEREMEKEEEESSEDAESARESSADDDDESRDANDAPEIPETLDALVTAMTTPTTPPPVMRLMHGAFGVLVATLFGLAVYTMGEEGNVYVWFLAVVNALLWGAVTKLASSIGDGTVPGDASVSASGSSSDAEDDGEEKEEERELLLDGKEVLSRG
ncbi:hypothetical protein H9P43_006423 [Blastocladiella emersonii ATCC 22665]|nr:hypothetical protein H9P43_006423 [Blastocladiella emersonii ATCC 22665]